MKRIQVISGSRADAGLLEMPRRALATDFEVRYHEMWGLSPDQAFRRADTVLNENEPDCLLILGDRFEIVQAALAAHLRRIPIAHLCGGDVSLGSYDDAHRDCISRLATWHFPTSDDSSWRLARLVARSDDYLHMSGEHFEIHMVGNIALDYIMHGDWRRELLVPKPYVVVSYQCETADGTIDWGAVLDAVGDAKEVYVIRPNPDDGSQIINDEIDRDVKLRKWTAIESLPHGEFLNLIDQCALFIGNSSAMLYEAPALGVKCRMIGKRQEGRVAPTGDGKASERIREVLCRAL